MKKNVIRLTEAELKQYISKVVSEQTTSPAATEQANHEKITSLSRALVGKNVQLYLDATKTKKSHMVNVTSVGFSKSNAGLYWINTKDLAWVTTTGGANTPEDGVGPIKYLRFDCTEPTQFIGMGEGGKNIGTLFCPPLSELIKKTVGCQVVNKTADIATAKPAAPAAAPEAKPDFA